MNPSSFLVHLQSSVEIRRFFRTNLIKLLRSDYIVYGIFVWKNFFPFLTDWVQSNFKVNIKFLDEAQVLYIRVDSSVMIYISLVVKISIVFIAVVLTDICNCSYLNC